MDPFLNFKRCDLETLKFKLYLRARIELKNDQHDCQSRIWIEKTLNSRAILNIFSEAKKKRHCRWALMQTFFALDTMFIWIDPSDVGKLGRELDAHIRLKFQSCYTSLKKNNSGTTYEWRERVCCSCHVQSKVKNDHWSPFSCHRVGVPHRLYEYCKI